MFKDKSNLRSKKLERSLDKSEKDKMYLKTQKPV